MYFGEHNVQGMFKVLDPLHLKLEKGPETLKEISFNHVIHPFFCPSIHSIELHPIFVGLWT